MSRDWLCCGDVVLVCPGTGYALSLIAVALWEVCSCCSHSECLSMSETDRIHFRVIGDKNKTFDLDWREIEEKGGKQKERW